MRSYQSGSASLVTVAALAALSLTTIFVSVRQKETSQDLEKSRISNSRNLTETLNVSNIATFKALVSDSKIAGKYEPALYPANYFENQWKLLKNPKLVLSHVELTQGKVQLSSLRTNQANYEDFLGVLKGDASILTKFSQPYVLEIVRQNSRPGQPYLVESIDVRTESEMDPAFWTSDFVKLLWHILPGRFKEVV